MNTTEKLIEDLSAARAAADLVAPGDDGGTCNMDSCVLRLRKKQKGLSVEAAFLAAGLSGWYEGSGFWRGWFITAPHGGQANMRTRQVEAIGRVLRERGWDVGMYYQMD